MPEALTILRYALVVFAAFPVAQVLDALGAMLGLDTPTINAALNLLSFAALWILIERRLGVTQARAERIEEERDAALARLASEMTVGAMVYDLDRRLILAINDAGARLYGRAAKDMVGTPYTDYADPTAERITAERITALNHGQRDPGYEGARITINRPDGERRILEFSQAAEPNGAPGARVGLATFRDVTALVEQEAREERRREAERRAAIAAAKIDALSTYIERPGGAPTAPPGHEP